jgi:hypothetical protein
LIDPLGPLNFGLEPIKSGREMPLVKPIDRELATLLPLPSVDLLRFALTTSSGLLGRYCESGRDDPLLEEML